MKTNPQVGEVPQSAVPPGLITALDRPPVLKLKRRAILEDPFGTSAIEDSGHSRTAGNSCPEGTAENSSAFQRRVGRVAAISPVGTADWGNSLTCGLLFTHSHPFAATIVKESAEKGDVVELELAGGFYTWFGS